MEGFTYSNIFETKGIEYLVIIGFFAILVPFWFILTRQTKITRKIHETLGILTAGIVRIPQGLFFSQFHCWTFLEKSGIAKVGLDDLLLHLTGEAQFMKNVNSGDKIRKGDLLGTISQQGKVLKILSPVSGEVTSYNPILIKDSNLMNEDPYGKGWLFKIRPSCWISETSSYHLAEEATKWSANELNRFRDFLANSLPVYSPEYSGVVLQDGGELRDHTLSDLPEEIWKAFQADFLSSDLGKPNPQL